MIYYILWVMFFSFFLSLSFIALYYAVLYCLSGE